MSNGSNSNNGEWQMPDPIFRSSAGKTPKSAKKYVDPDDIDTEAPEFSEADTDEFDTEPIDQEEIDTETPDAEAEEETKEYPVAPVDDELASPTVRASEKQPRSAGGCARSMLMLVGFTTFTVLTVVAILIYYLFYYTPANTTF